MPLKIGLVGAGHGQAYAEAFSRIDDAKVVALAALPADTRRDDVRQKFGIDRLFDSYTDMLHAHAAHPLDVVIVAVPPVLHRRVVCDVLEAGSNCGCEKPPAINSRDARDMFFRSLFLDRHLGWLWCYRHIKNRPPVRPQATSAHVVWRRSTRNGAAWAQQHDVAGGGALLDLGCHGLDLAWVLLGCPQPRTAQASMFGPDGRPTLAKIEHDLRGVVEFTSGQRLTIDTSWDAQDDVQRIDFCGARGTEWRNTLVAESDPDLFWRTAHGLLSDLFEANRAQQIEKTSQGVKIMTMVDALYQSAVRDTIVSIP